MKELKLPCFFFFNILLESVREQNLCFHPFKASNALIFTLSIRVLNGGANPIRLKWNIYEKGRWLLDFYSVLEAIIRVNVNLEVHAATPCIFKPSNHSSGVPENLASWVIFPGKFAFPQGAYFIFPRKFGRRFRTEQI